jgi:hypothetical protein
MECLKIWERPWTRSVSLGTPAGEWYAMRTNEQLADEFGIDRDTDDDGDASDDPRGGLLGAAVGRLVDETYDRDGILLDWDSARSLVIAVAWELREQLEEDDI